MTPAQLITEKLRDRIAAGGATVPVYSLLLEAAAGAKHEAKSSGIAVTVHISGQNYEALPTYAFRARVALTVSIDDDKGGTLFMENYDALWAVFDDLARGDACVSLGSAAADASPVFFVDGFQLAEGDDPDYQADENGGAWTVSFAATITGRAPTN